MKYAIIIPDGAADVPLEELNGRTPLQVAKIPNMDWIASNGKLGTVCNVPDGLPCGSDVAMMSVLGYDPRKNYTGRAPIEAAAREIEVAPDEWIFRCNLVTIVDGVMEDYSAGHINNKEAGALVDDLNRTLGGGTIRFYPGVGYRHLMTVKGNVSVRTTPPHDILGKKVSGYLPRGAGADMLVTLTERSGLLFADHPINVVRRDLGENPATSIWLWGEGKMPELAPFSARYQLRGSAITAVDLVRGLAKLIGWDCIEVEGATGYLDTNYAGKGQAAVEAIDAYDLVLVHVEAPDEAGHNADARGKVHALEEIDADIVRPVLERLQAQGENDWRIMVLPDHPTPCTVRTHTGEAVPFAIAGGRVKSLVAAPFTEATAAASDLHIPRGCDLMEYFLTVR